MTVVENDVVKMSLDPKGLLDGAKAGLQALDRLKEGMNFGKSLKHFDEITAASRRVDFNPLASGVDVVTTRISAMGVMTATVINRITDSVINSAKKLFDQAIMGPLKTGMSEYETQMGAIQTILANTASKGTSLDDVNSALDILNAYADKTIYNFTQMTDSIGRFTAAGVDLDTSVSAIKGISNLAAVSGSTALQASTAMYQLSQAIASGTIRLMDWNSVQTAGMGGEIFQDALKETARVHGVAIDQIIKREGSFRDSLQTGWLSSEIMLETLSKFTGDLSAEQLKTMGYTEEQIQEIMKLAEMANDAATKVKTLTQLKDTAMEAIQSGWAVTWRAVFGEFDEAKNMFTELMDIFGGIISESAATRNNMLSFWKDMGGRDELVQGLLAAIKKAIFIIGIFRDAWQSMFPRITGEQLFFITEAISDLFVNFRLGVKGTNQLTSVFRGLTSVLDIFKMLVIAIAKPLISMVKDLLPAGDGMMAWASSTGDMLFALRNFIKDTKYFDVVIAKLILKIHDASVVVKRLWASFMQLAMVKDIVGYLQSLEKADFINAFEKAKVVLKALADFLFISADNVRNLWEQFRNLKGVKGVIDSITWENFKKFVRFVIDSVPVAIQRYKDFVQGIKDFVSGAKELGTTLTGTKGVQKVFAMFQSFSLSNITGAFNGLKEAMSGVTSIADSVNSSVGGVSSTASDATSIIDTFKDKAREMFDTLVDYLNNVDGEVAFDGMIHAVNTGIFAGLVLGIRKALTSLTSGTRISDMITGVMNKYIGPNSPVVRSITSVLGSIEGAMVAWQNNLKADTLLKIAGAVAIVVASATVLSMINPKKLAVGVAAIGGMMVQLFSGAAMLAKMSLQGIVAATSAVVGLSIGLLFMSIAVAKFGTMEQKVLEQGLVGVAAALVVFITALKAIGMKQSSLDIIESAASMGILALALYGLSIAIEKMGTLDPGVVEQGLTRMAAALLGFIVFAQGMDNKKSIEASLGVGAMAYSLVLISDSIKALGSMSWDETERGLLAMGVSLGILAVAMKLMSGSLTGAAAIVIVSVALLAIAGGVTMLSKLKLKEVGIALLAIAGVFTVLGVAGLLLAPLVPVLLGLGAAMALIGLGALVLGAGIFIAATGLVMLAGAATAVAAGIAIIGGAVITLLPMMAEGLTNAIVNFVVTLSERAPEFFEAGRTLLLTLLQSMISVVPELILGLMDVVTQLLTALIEKGPEFMAKGSELILIFLEGTSEKMAEITAAGVRVVTEFIKGLTESIPELVTAVFDFMEALGLAIGTELDNRIPGWVAGMKDAAFKMVEGLTQGIKDGIARVKAAIEGLGLAAIERLVALLKIQSPSKVFLDIGGNLVKGFVNGITGGVSAVKDATSQLARGAQNGMSLVLSEVKTSLDTLSVWNPTITPVLDLSGVTKDMDRFGGSMSVNALADTLSGRITDSASAQGGSGSTKDGVTFIQYNNSPKALSTAEIFRQTRMQISRLQPEYTT